MEKSRAELEHRWGVIFTGAIGPDYGETPESVVGAHIDRPNSAKHPATQPGQRQNLLASSGRLPGPETEVSPERAAPAAKRKFLSHARVRALGVPQQIRADRTIVLLPTRAALTQKLALAPQPAVGDGIGTDDFSLVHGRCIPKPSDRSTLPGVLLSLLHIAQKDPHAIVAFIPVDRFYSSDEGFVAAVHEAFECAAANPHTVVLLGARPTRIETRYGYIEPRRPMLGASGRLSRLRNFIETPSQELARELIGSGWLWNTFVMFGHVRALLDAIKRSEPALFALFASVTADGGVSEMDALSAVYDKIDCADFSRRVLTTCLDRLAVLPLDQSDWDDLDDPNRVIRVLEGPQELELAAH